MFTLLNTHQAAEKLGLSTSFLNKARLEGNGPSFIKLGSKVSYEMSDLESWINNRRRRSTSDDGSNRGQ